MSCTVTNLKKIPYNCKENTNILLTKNFKHGN
jgi:hypothetical protein